MTCSPSRSALSTYRLGASKPGNGDYAPVNISPTRQTLRPAVAEEGVRHFEDVPLPLWGVAARRTVSPASRRYKGVLELGPTGAVESGTSPSRGAGSNLSLSSPPTPPPNGTAVQLPPSAFADPHTWEREYAQLRTRFLRPSNAVTIYHDYASPLNSRATMRHACVVRPLPNLEKVQEALRRRLTASKCVSAYDVVEQQCSSYTANSSSFSVIEDTVSVAPHEGGATMRGAHSEQRNDTFLSAARTWCVGGSTYDKEITVYSSTTGQRLMRVVDIKAKVAVTALQHAPFRAFMEAQQLHVLPVREPQDVLRLKSSHLVYTDYVWCGLQDGTLRLIPASHQHIRAGGPSPLYSKGASADLVYELPRYQGGAIVSIVCSPGHDEIGEVGGPERFADGGRCVDAAAPHIPNRVSEAVRFMTAAAASESGAASASSDPSRRHLSLVCTASTDATVIIWDVRKVYEAVAHAQRYRHDMAKTEGGGPGNLSMSPHCSLGTTQACQSAAATAAAPASMLCNDVITFDCSSPVPGLQNMVVRSSCTLIQVRPVAKLSGGFAGLTALRWVSSLITAGTTDGAARDKRDVRADTRISQIAPCPSTAQTPRCELSQTQTRFDKREGQRAELELEEEEMQGMERELEHMMPPVAAEPPQSLRVNLLLAADCLGTVHVWNLDEELHRYGDSTTVGSALGWPADFGASSRSSVRSLSSQSEGRSSVSHVLELSAESMPARPSTKRKAAVSGGASSRDSGGTHKKTERSLRSRRPLGGLGLAEARESRSRLSELPANTAPALGHGASLGHKSQRPSLGRTSCEEAEINAVHNGRWPHGAAEPGESQRHSTGDATPPLAPTRKSHLLRSRRDTNASTAPNSSKTTGSGTATTRLTKKAKKPRSSLQEEASTASQSRQQSTTSPSRNSQLRPSISPGRHGDSHLHALPSTSMMRPRTSVQRGPSRSLGNNSGNPVHDFGMPAQTSKCQIAIAEGVPITEMVVDLPPLICTTLRRIHHPSRVTASWQHRPTEEEMDARVLENEFEELTEEKALFFTFQKLELYVGVDSSAVTTVRCAPVWVLPDHDGRELFKLRGKASATEWNEDMGNPTATIAAAPASPAATAEWMTEVTMPEVVKMGAFQLHLHRRLLFAHAQPITQLFLDAWQGRLWASRRDGCVFILSTHDKQLLARIPHPSADSLLPQSPAQDWTKTPAQSNARWAEESRNRAAADVGGMDFGLEYHKECKGLPPNHLTEVLPMGTHRQRALILFTSSTATETKATTAGVAASTTVKRRLSLLDESHQMGGSSALKGLPLDLTSTASVDASCPNTTTSAATLVCLDGQSDMKSESRARESHQWRWMRQLQQCRVDSFAACQAQRRRYYALCEGISHNVGHVMKELGEYVALSQLRTYFHAWMDHRALFRHTHLMRRQRTARLRREQPLAHALSVACAMQLRGTYLVRWMQHVAERRRAKHDASLHCFARAAVAAPGDVRDHLRLRRHRRPLPTAAMMARLHLLSSARAYFARWQSWAAEAAALGRPHRSTEEEPSCLPYTLLLSLTRSASSPFGTPLRRVRSGQRSADAAVEGGAGAPGASTPNRAPHSSSSGEAYAYTSSWTSGRRCTGEEALTPSRERLGGTSLSLPVSVEPFMAEMAELLRARVDVFHFSDARSSATSVLDESWTVILQNAESGADGDSVDERRFSVFRFALLPLLQGLLSTADDVLPNLFDSSVAEEVLSMLVGIVLAMDYVTADAECMLWPPPAVGDTSTDSSVNGGCAAGPFAHVAFHDENTQLTSAFDASLAVLRLYAVRAFRTDAEAAEVLRGLAKGKTVFAQFLDFAVERAVARRMEQFCALV
ncbi:hypothetical protein ABB37_05084 [Leptomonas pyrrhocoris]|uniref:Uncharacterized protein n=1 Tax=Leptomonas pyrrhocoris TaxID=157538 RepID=A0A0M9G0W6_LEPPY|nr:hypothetical protein ABB37_05084 [Leptomonas pyrrhocoris]KPA80075.1 hypothetical protein ABB37_05084 [Leptomonas pyrrhocoris]|eukprot:XP_015658514.1 hypothetical protein ABB37_05084 [Leptomonas pyrrhocoris]